MKQADQEKLNPLQAQAWLLRLDGQLMNPEGLWLCPLRLRASKPAVSTSDSRMLGCIAPGLLGEGISGPPL